jgi:hypothetical protein
MVNEGFATWSYAENGKGVDQRTAPSDNSNSRNCPKEGPPMCRICFCTSIVTALVAGCVALALASDDIKQRLEPAKTTFNEEMVAFQQANQLKSTTLALPGYHGRSGAAKNKLLSDGGGNEETEAAVELALAWLAKQQNEQGFWQFDGSQKADKVAATGMCLLPFLAVGETHLSGKKYKETVKRGIDYLKSLIKANGQFDYAGMYSQAIATMALCEAAGLTRDASLKEVAKKAVDFIVEAQVDEGSWGYTAGRSGDTSIVGWQIQALRSAELAHIPIPPKCFEKAGEFLVSVSSDKGVTYGYRAPGPTHTLTAVGLLSRQSMGWTARNPSLLCGVDYLWTKFPPKDGEWDMYYYYYATQVVHLVGGPAWQRDWNPVMRGVLLKKQMTQKNATEAQQADVGSWSKDGGHIGSACGKLGTTALACLTLQVYYRYAPIEK